jgi:hypothetical protein
MNQMAETTIAYQVVVFTQHHSFSGGLFLRDQRLSDHLNDRRDTTIGLRNVTVARLEEPAKILERTLFSAVPKEGIVIAFEPPQKIAIPQKRYIMYSKDKYDVFIVTDGMEIHGELNVTGALDLRTAITNASASFLPITQAVVTLKAAPALVVKREAVLVNSHRIRFIGEVEPKKTAAPPPPQSEEPLQSL